MKSLLVCIVSNEFELGIVRRTRELMKHRLGDWEIGEAKAGSGIAPPDLSRICDEARKNGYKRICFQAATMAFSEERYRDLITYIEKIRKSMPEIELTVFPPSQLFETCADLIERSAYHASLPDKPFHETSPDEIQTKSFELISRRLAKTYDDPDTKAIVVRIIHATADFSVENLLRFSNDAVAKGKEAIGNGCPIITDVGMVSAGLSTQFKDRTISAINQEGVTVCAKRLSVTRSAAGIVLLADKLDGAIVAIGNAPTALVQLVALVKKTGISPACVIGVPVGFVGAAESKELLMASDIPCISMKGNRGGTPVAVAAVNALGCLRP